MALRHGEGATAGRTTGVGSGTTLGTVGAGVDAAEDFQRLFLRDYRTIVWSVNLVVHDFPRAEELTQDAFVRLLERWSTVSRYDRPGAWVRRVALRLAAKAADRERRRRSLESALPPPSEPIPVDLDLVAAVAQLPARQRAVVALHYWEDLPTRDIADILGCSESTVAVHLHRARRRLAELVGEEAEVDVDR